MSRLRDAELALLKPEGSHARIEAVKAAKRREMQRRFAGPQVDTAASIDRIVADQNAKHRAAFDTLVSAIDNADGCGSSMAVMLKKIAMAALNKAHPEFAEDAASPAQAE